MLTATKILLIDDDVIDRKVVIRTLNNSNNKYEITEVITAAEGLSLAATNSFDAILLDYFLPDQNGLELLIELRKKVGHSTAIVMLSQYEDDNIIQRCLDAGANDFLLKDEVNRNRLSRSIRHARYRCQIDDELHSNNENLLLMAEHDVLTGLCNRRGFERAISHVAERINCASGNLSVVLLDLDNFKLVNDTAGHEAGDILLVEVSKRLRECLRETDIACRLGGDEFVIIVNDFENNSQIYSLAERILSQMQVEFIIGEMNYLATVSIGVAFYNPPAITISNLLHCADIALYQSKSAGRNQFSTYSSNLKKITEHRTSIKNDLFCAIKNNQLDLFYQAQIRPKDGSLGGVEALIRWQHPSHGLLLPKDFMQIAEETRLISEIQSWVLHTAYEKFSLWVSRYPNIFRNTALGINISTRYTDSKRLNDTLSELSIIHALLANHLEIEINESALIKDLGRSTQILSAFARKGLAISIDNFGSGFTSINDLKQLPISFVKIDQGYINSIRNGKKDQQLLIALINLAKILDIRVVAQGIETKYQAEFCSKHGCDLLQGYYYCHPCPADEFEEKFMTNSC